MIKSYWKKKICVRLCQFPLIETEKKRNLTTIEMHKPLKNLTSGTQDPYRSTSFLEWFGCFVRGQCCLL